VARPLTIKRAYYADPIGRFLARSDEEVLGQLASGVEGALESAQRDAWLEQIRVVKAALTHYSGRGKVYFEFAVPRVGKRIDAVVILDHAIFVIEFKIGEADFQSGAIEQVWDYALDLKNFHETSHTALIAPVLVPTRASSVPIRAVATHHGDGLLRPIRAAVADLPAVFERVLSLEQMPAVCDIDHWETGRYRPTPTIIEAARALYRRHGVDEIIRNDAEEKLSITTDALEEIIADARVSGKKAICFVTGVPGAGKTLVGLNTATHHAEASDSLHSVFLSGNGPLVEVLREALARDKVSQERDTGRRITKKAAMGSVSAFIQNVHHFRDEYIRDAERPPFDHVVIFDEAQRAWNLEQTAAFMRRKRGLAEFDQSEPEFLISCMDRHRDWAVIVCLVGGGQEINTGEAGIGAWLDAVSTAFPSWKIHMSPQLSGSEYAAEEALARVGSSPNCHHDPRLHLHVSMRSFRSERVSEFVKLLLDLDEEGATAVLREHCQRYPIVATRDLGLAKSWLRSQARGSERFGMVVSSSAERLKPHAIDVRPKIRPSRWFLAGRTDVRSSYYLEDVATEFHVQGLELDWTCVVWDADLRHAPGGWKHFEFKGSRWQRVKQAQRQSYLKNAYRVLMTRARQGMVIVVPPGDAADPTRKPEYYDCTWEYLGRIGVPTLTETSTGVVAS
jgi:hypothetical protein